MLRELSDGSRLSGSGPGGGDWASNPAIFLRELLTFNFFLPLMDLLGEPDTINLLLGVLFDPEPSPLCEEPPGPSVPVLAKLTAVLPTPSLLQRTI